MEKRERRTGTGERPPPPLPTRTGPPRVLPGAHGPLAPELIAAPRARRSASRCVPPHNPGPRPGLHPARCCSGRRRGAGRGALPSAARPERGFAEPRRRVLRGRERPLGDRRALGGGRPGAASSSSSATAAASSRCSVSREPRLVDAAEALGSAAAASSPEVQPHLRVAPRAQRAGLWARPETPTPPSPVPPNPSRLAFLDSSLGKMVPAAGEVSGGRWPPAAGAATCGGGRAERAGRCGGPDSCAQGGVRRVPAKLAEPPGFALLLGGP